MQNTRIKNVITKTRKKIFKGFPTKNQYVPIKNAEGKVLRHKLIVHLLNPFKNESIQKSESEFAENETRDLSNDE